MLGDRRKFKRDLRVDFLRGLALLTIFIDHIPGNRWAAVTQQNFGYSDAAEMFVVLAGFSAVLAYGRYFDSDELSAGVRKIAARIGTIYVYHIGTLLAVGIVLTLAAALAHDSTQVQTMKFEQLLAGDLTAMASALLLVEQPKYFDILPLYVVLLAAFPLIYIALRRSLLLGLIASATLWLTVQLTEINFQTVRGEGWHFNPLAWQFLLVLGIAAAMRIRRGPIAHSRWLIAIAVIILVGALLLRAPWTNWPLHVGAPLVDLKPYGAWMIKTHLGPFRLIHIVAFAYLLLVLVPPRANWLKTAPARVVADAGSSSLEVFCIGVVLAVVGAAIVDALGSGPVIETWVTSTGVAALLLAGLTIARSLRARRRARARVANDVPPRRITVATRPAELTGRARI